MLIFSFRLNAHSLLLRVKQWFCK